MLRIEEIASYCSIQLLRPYLNKVYQAEYEGVASGEFIILETIKSVSPNYLKLILHQQDFVHWSNKQSSGDKIAQLTISPSTRVEVE